MTEANTERGPAAGEAVVPDVVTVELPVGATVLACSDLHLEATATASSASVAAEVAAAVADIEGDGAVVLAGDCFELLSGPSTDPADALGAHPVLRAALHAFASTSAHQRHIVVLAGNHDGRLAWDGAAVTGLARSIGGEVALAADLVIGGHRVRVEHGHQLDPPNAFAFPRDPHDTPLGHHLVTELLPSLHARSGWLDDVEHLIDPASFVRFVVSRLVYRKVLPRWWWLLVPVAAALAIRLAVTEGMGSLDSWPRRIMLATGGTAIDVLFVVLLLGLVVPRVWRRLSDVSLVSRSGSLNDAPRARAGELVAEGYAGFITGHTHRPEATPVGAGFYANTGCGNEVAHEWPARLGLPPVFLVDRELSYVELVARPDRLLVRLHQARLDLGRATALERLLARRTPAASRPVTTDVIEVS